MIMASRRKFEFYDEERDVWVIFKFPSENKKTYVEEREPYDPEDGDNFARKRTLINVKLFEKSDNKINYPEVFKGRFSIKVYYIQEDIINADGLEKLLLGYWDGSRWTTFTVEEHGLEMVPEANDKWKGHAKVNITSWPDPVIAWGK